MATDVVKPVEIPKPMMQINIPWDTLDLREAQIWYARLKHEFERAGWILNQRSCTASEEKWTCFMAGKTGACAKGIVHSSRPVGIDYGHKDKHGLLKPARICSERCWLLYQKLLIDERRAREIAAAQRNP